MSELDKKLLQQEYAFYTNLLKKHETTSSGFTSKTSQNPQSNMQTLLNHNISSSLCTPTHSMKSSSQPILNKPVYQNQRTILLNKNKYVSDKTGHSRQNFREVKLPPNRVMKEKGYVKSPASHIKNSVNNTIPSNLPNKSSESEKLLKEIVFLTKLINSNEKSVNKSSFENMSTKGPMNTGLKSNISGCQRNVKVADNKNAANLLHQSSTFTAPTKRRIVVNSRISQPTSTSHQMLTAKNDAFKVENSMKRTVLNKSLAGSLSALPSFQNMNKQNASRFQTTASTHLVQTPKKEIFRKGLGLDSFSSEYKINKQPSFLPKHSFPSKKIKTPILVRHSVFSKSHEKSSRRIVKHHSKNKLIYTKISPVSQKCKKLNSKYKIVNATDAQNFSKGLKNKSLESSLLNESDSFTDLLNDTEIDKLEKQLLAATTSISATPKPSTSYSLVAGRTCSKSYIKRSPKCQLLASKYKIVNKNMNHKNSRYVLSRTPTKKLKMLSSKYKVINKIIKTPKLLSLKNKQKTPCNSVRKVSKKVVLTKFAIVNKHSPVITAFPKSNSVLVKRLYKSKSTLINKNDSPTSYSAKLIKSKYFGVKRKSSLQKPYLHPKVAIMQKYGSYNNRLVSNKYKCVTYRGSKRTYSKKINYISPMRYCKNNDVPKRKGNKVLNIRGSSYSMCLSGKKIKRLPTKGQLWINKTPKISIAGKTYFKQPENMMKVIHSPLSLHVANRVLHRSINRVITATNKKSLSKVNTYCMFYNRFGRCNRGVKCTYIHDPSKIAVCTRFLRGTCKTEGCPFSHEVTPGKMAICSFFLVGACDKGNCPYRHEPLAPNAVLCKAFVQGYCPKGKECNKAHILICPKFILGECEKGSSCAYPHPPQKAKKVLSKDTVVDKVVPPCDTKDDDGLLEKVARYFQSEGNSIPYTEKNSFQLFVPKPRKLEEQPAFIPLSNTPVSSTAYVIDKV